MRENGHGNRIAEPIHWNQARLLELLTRWETAHGIAIAKSVTHVEPTGL
jgi:hypothetical protein